MTEERKNFWTMVSTMLAAAAALATLPISYHYNELFVKNAQSSLDQAANTYAGQEKRAKEEAVERANAYARQETRAKEETAERAKAFAQQEKRAKGDAAERAKQFDAQLALAQKTLEEEKAQWKIERDEQERILTEQRRPVLVPLQCCSYQVGIILDQTRDVNNTFIRLPYSNLEKGKFPSHFNIGYIVRIKNIGLGSADRIAVKWHVDTIIDRDGTVTDYETGVVSSPTGGISKFNKDEYRESQESLSETFPITALSSGEVEIRRLPGIIQIDKDKKIKRVEGKAKVGCFNIAGKPYSVRTVFGWKRITTERK